MNVAVHHLIDRSQKKNLSQQQQERKKENKVEGGGGGGGGRVEKELEATERKRAERRH